MAAIEIPPDTNDKINVNSSIIICIFVYIPLNPAI